MKRNNYSSETKWEETAGYSRAVKVGNVIEVAGTTATDENGNVIGAKDPYLQTRCIIEKIQKYLQKAGASLEHVTRTRIFVTDIRQWEEIGKAHGEYFDTIKPAATMLEVSRLIHPELLVEMEVTAIIS